MVVFHLLLKELCLLIQFVQGLLQLAQFMFSLLSVTMLVPNVLVEEEEENMREEVRERGVHVSIPWRWH